MSDWYVVSWSIMINIHLGWSICFLGFICIICKCQKISNQWIWCQNGFINQIEILEYKIFRFKYEPKWVNQISFMNIGMMQCVSEKIINYMISMNIYIYIYIYIWISSFGCELGKILLK